MLTKRVNFQVQKNYLSIDILSKVWLILMSVSLQCSFYSEVMVVAESLQNKVISGMDTAEAWNEMSVELLRCAKVNATFKCSSITTV